MSILKCKKCEKKEVTNNAFIWGLYFLFMGVLLSGLSYYRGYVDGKGGISEFCKGYLDYFIYAECGELFGIMFAVLTIMLFIALLSGTLVYAKWVKAEYKKIK